MAISFFGSATQPADAGTYAVSPAVITPPGSMTSGQLVVVFEADRTNSSALAVSATGGQTWTSETVQNPTGQRSSRVYWCTFNGTWSTDPSFVGGATNTTLIMAVFTPTSGATWSVDVAHAAGLISTSPQTITGITCAAASVAVFCAMSIDDNNNTFSNFTTVASIDNMAGSDTSTIVGYKLMPSGGATGDVVVTQTTNSTPDNGIYHTISFVEASSSPQTVTLSLLDQSSTLFAPKVNLGVSLSLLDQSSTLFAPTVSTAGGAQSVTLPLLDQSSTLFSPKVNQALALPLLSQSPTLFGPTVKQAVALPLLSSSPTLFAPKVNEAVALPLLSQAPILFAPSVKQAVSLPLLNQQATLFAPTITIPGPQTITLPLLDGTATLFAPSVKQAISLPRLDQNPSLFAPSISSASPQTITLPLLSNLATLLAPLIVSGGFGVPVDPALAVDIATPGLASLAGSEGRATLPTTEGTAR